MAEENQLRLYKHFIETGQTEQAEAILKVYPDFAGEVKADTKKSKK